MTTRSSGQTNATRPSRSDARRRQIIEAAGSLVLDDGFHDVTMSKIAESIRLTPGALYRHFASKNELLQAVFEDYFSRAYTAQRAATLAQLLDHRASSAIDAPQLGLLWTRESRHLTSEQRHGFSMILRRDVDEVRTKLQVVRPELKDGDAGFLSWAIQSVLGSTEGKIRGMSASAYSELLFKACIAVAQVEPGRGPNQDPPQGFDYRMTSKRENILQAAGKLFGTNGYRDTSLAQVGAETGVGGPSLYTHFENKKQLLTAVLDRVDNAQWMELRVVVDTSADADEALRRAVASKIHLSRAQPYVVAILETDVHEVPEFYLQRQQDYAIEFRNLLIANRPELAENVADALVRASLKIINDFSRIKFLANYPNSSKFLEQAVRAVLAS